MSDTVSTLAIDALESAVSSLLPGNVPPGLARSVRVSARSIAPLGLGGYVGSHVGPGAALLGRRVRARVDVGVSGGADSLATSYVAALSGQMLAFTRSEFATRGIHRLTNANADGVRALAFDIDFEFVPTPAAGEGTISTLALESYTNLTPYRTRLLADFAGASLAQAADPLAAFQAEFLPVADPDAAPAGAWSLDGNTIAQTAASVGGALEPGDPVKAGAVLLWRPKGAPLLLSRGVISLQFESPGSDGVGIVFGHTGANDYLFFVASARHDYHLIGRRTPGGWQTLVSAAAGYATDRAQRLVLTWFDGQVAVDLDERRTLAQSGLPPLRGEIGLLTHGNATARFGAGRVMALE